MQMIEPVPHLLLSLSAFLLSLNGRDDDPHHPCIDPTTSVCDIYIQRHSDWQCQYGRDYDYTNRIAEWMISSQKSFGKFSKIEFSENISHEILPEIPVDYSPTVRNEMKPGHRLCNAMTVVVVVCEATWIVRWLTLGLSISGIYQQNRVWRTRHASDWAKIYR